MLVVENTAFSTQMEKGMGKVHDTVSLVPWDQSKILWNQWKTFHWVERALDHILLLSSPSSPLCCSICFLLMWESFSFLFSFFFPILINLYNLWALSLSFMSHCFTVCVTAWLRAALEITHENELPGHTTMVSICRLQHPPWAVIADHKISFPGKFQNFYFLRNINYKNPNDLSHFSIHFLSFTPHQTW